jgi:molybdate transport system permease protein
MNLDWQPIFLSLKVAMIALLFVFLLGTAAAVFMVRKQFFGKAVLESLFTLPLVLPPVVTGFLLLVLLGRSGPIGRWLDDSFHTRIVFTPAAAVIAAIVIAFPLMYQSAKAALQSVDTHLEDAARTLGAGELRVVLTVTLPLAFPGMIAGGVLAFARALGEFGATIMIAGDIPGKTQTLPLAIYFAAESNDMRQAGLYVAVICALTFCAVFSLHYWLKSKGAERGKTGGGLC